MHLTDGEDVVVADEAPAFAAAVKRVYEDRLLWQRLSDGGRANVTRHFSPAVAEAALRELLALPLDDEPMEHADPQHP
jgi:glycosyltransferase involved in cell wall biosynthesis